MSGVSFFYISVLFRWTIGAGEVFHYFMVKVRNIPFFTALSWGITFILYYGRKHTRKSKEYFGKE